MKILVGMSGGVDSSYAAKKLLGEGHTVVGAYLIMHGYSEEDSARDAAGRLGIPLVVIDCREAFDRNVRENFISEYVSGRTPNPCVVCNPTVKFKALRDYAVANEFDAIATGHYATVKTYEFGGKTRHAIGVATDLRKDQSYMLYRLPEEILSVLLLPLGELSKEMIKRELSANGLSELVKKDSQEICFLPDGDYAGYIESICGKSDTGNFIDCEGNILGKHDGIIRYTIGQRKGLGISASSRLYVTDIDAESGNITLDDKPALKSDVIATGVYLIPGYSERLASGRELSVKIRYAATPVPARVRLDGKGRINAKLYEPARSVTPGQSLVLYDGDIVVGGGFIIK